MIQKNVRYVHTVFELNWCSGYDANWGNLLDMVETKEFKPPESYCNLNPK